MYLWAAAHSYIYECFKWKVSGREKKESIWKEIIIKKKVNKDKKKKYIAFWGGGRLQVMIGHSCYKDKMV